MADKEALRLADALDECQYVDVYRCKQAAAKLRRLAPVEAQRDALLEKVQAVIDAEQSEGRGRGGFVNKPPTRDHQNRVAKAWQELHIVIAQIKGGSNG